jgi:hypothetical protein
LKHVLYSLLLVLSFSLTLTAFGQQAPRSHLDSVIQNKNRADDSLSQAGANRDTTTYTDVVVNTDSTNESNYSGIWGLFKIVVNNILSFLGILFLVTLVIYILWSNYNKKNKPD